MNIVTDTGNFQGSGEGSTDLPILRQQLVTNWLSKQSVQPGNTEIDAVNRFMYVMKSYNFLSRMHYIFITNKTVKADCWINLNEASVISLPNAGEVYTTAGIDFSNITSIPILQLDPTLGDYNNIFRAYITGNAPVGSKTIENVITDVAATFLLGQKNGAVFTIGNSTNGAVLLPLIADKAGAFYMNRKNGLMFGGGKDEVKFATNYAASGATYNGLLRLGVYNAVNDKTTLKPKAFFLGYGFTPDESATIYKELDRLYLSI